MLFVRSVFDALGDSGVDPPASFRTSVCLCAACERVCVVGLTPAAHRLVVLSLYGLLGQIEGVTPPSVDAIFSCAIKSQSILFK